MIVSHGRLFVNKIPVLPRGEIALSGGESGHGAMVVPKAGSMWYNGSSKTKGGNPMKKRIKLADRLLPDYYMQ